jgi:3-dehydroquinate synthase
MEKELTVHLREKSYPIVFEKNLFEQESFFDRCLAIAHFFVLVTQNSLIPKVAAPLIKKLKEKNIPYCLLTFPPGEKYKTRKTKEYLENQMFRYSIGRESAILSLGGGVVSDLAGFLAATYMRSLPLIHVPTTLVGMIDAAVGGKTAVNTPYGKNTVGAFYQPKAVFIDSLFLQTLPRQELQNGIVEMIKYALIEDPKIFSMLEKKSGQILSQNAFLDEMIFTCLSIKKRMVEEDEMDREVRRLLGFGHTLGHAIESSCNYRISHGMAVYLGILGESFLSMRKNLLSKKSFERISALFTRFEIGLPPLTISKRKVLSCLSQDKKRTGKKASFVLLKDIGYPQINSSGYIHEVEKELVEEMVDYVAKIMQESMQCLQRL